MRSTLRDCFSFFVFCVKKFCVLREKLHFYVQATEDVMVETKCRTDKVGRDTAYGCYNATLYEKCGGVQNDEGLEYCGFFFPKKRDSHPERFKKLMGLSKKLFEKAKAHFWYKKD